MGEVSWFESTKITLLEGAASGETGFIFHFKDKNKYLLRST